MTLLSIVLGVLASVLLLPTVSDLISLLRIVPVRARNQLSPEAELPQLLFLVPAHNEEILIASCVRSVFQMHYPADRYSVAVIADNCTDRTAAVARAAGAQCLERNAPAEPGKPRAIAWALRQLSIEVYDAVVILDADTVVPFGFASALAQAAPLSEKALQAYYGVYNPSDNALTRLATVLAAANHSLAYPLKRLAGLNTPLLGNGMVIGTGILRAHGWRAFSIAEDWELYAQLTERGVKIECLSSAIIYSQEARTLRQSLSQRQRWTGGKLTVLVRMLGPLIKSRHISPRQKLDAVAELSAPGPVLHLCLVMLSTAAVLELQLQAGIAVALLGSLLRSLVYTLVALLLQPDPLRAAAAFWFLPLYALWRLSAAAAAVTMLGDKAWVRTRRNARSKLDEGDA